MPNRGEHRLIGERRGITFDVGTPEEKVYFGTVIKYDPGRIKEYLVEFENGDDSTWVEESELLAPS